MNSSKLPSGTLSHLFGTKVIVRADMNIYIYIYIYIYNKAIGKILKIFSLFNADDLGTLNAPLSQAIC